MLVELSLSFILLSALFTVAFLFWRLVFPLLLFASIHSSYQTEGAVSRHKAKLSAKSDWFKESRGGEGEDWVDDGGVGEGGKSNKKKREAKVKKEDKTAKKTETAER